MVSQLVSYLPLKGFSAHLLPVFLIFLGAWVGQKVGYRLIDEAAKKIKDAELEIGPREQRAQTLAGIAKNAVGVVIYAVAAMMALSEIGLNIAPIITGAGVLGLAVGFGTQTLVKDIVTGFFILLEGQFNKGDEVEVAKAKGRVKELNLRTTIIEGENKEIYIIPNSQISAVIKFPRGKK